MSEYPPNVILDARGEPVGLYRDNQDPDDPTRLHPVPRVNASGDPILDANGDPEVSLLPLDHPRTVKQLEKEGLQVDGNALVAIDGHELTDSKGGTSTGGSSDVSTSS